MVHLLFLSLLLMRACCSFSVFSAAASLCFLVLYDFFATAANFDIHTSLIINRWSMIVVVWPVIHKYDTGGGAGDLGVPHWLARWGYTHRRCEGDGQMAVHKSTALVFARPNEGHGASSHASQPCASMSDGQ